MTKIAMMQTITILKMMPMTNLDSLKDKYLLSVSEASRYFGINTAKVRNLAREYTGVSLYNGNKLLIKRIAFEKLIDSVESI